MKAEVNFAKQIPKNSKEQTMIVDHDQQSQVFCVCMVPSDFSLVHGKIFAQF